MQHKHRMSVRSIRVRNGLLHTALCCAIANALFASLLHAQDGSTIGANAPLRITASIGAGNETGGYGGVLEWHAPQRPLSIFAGGGRNVAGIVSARASWSMGLRMSVGSVRHKAVFSLARSPLLWPGIWHPDQGTRYGPTVTAGYRFVAHRGFTAQAAFGAGHVSARSNPWFREPARTVSALNLGLGYTWRRR